MEGLPPASTMASSTAEPSSTSHSLKVEEVQENPLLHRREVVFKVLHGEGGTPSRQLVRQLLAGLLKVPVDLVIVKELRTRARTGMTKGHAHVYRSREELLKVEPSYICLRNLPPQERAEALKKLKEAKAKAGEQQRTST